MWRIGQLARMVGVSERTLRHYDRIGLLGPAAVDGVNGYRWYGVTELSRLERIRGLRRLGLPLRQIADLLDAPRPRYSRRWPRSCRASNGTSPRWPRPSRTPRTTSPMSILPQQATVGPRWLRVRHLRVDHASDLAHAIALEVPVAHEGAQDQPGRLPGRPFGSAETR